MVLSGGIGACFGGILSGIVLAKYNVSLGALGAIGIIGGFLGYNSLKLYGKSFKTNYSKRS